MLSVDQIEEWLGQEVTDSDGERVGKLDEVYYSASSGEAMFASIKSGLLGRHSSVVPLAGASVGRDYVRLGYSAEQIDSAGTVAAPAGRLEREDARRVGESYGMQTPVEEDFEAASAIKERELAAGEALRRADELEEEARRRAAEAEDARAGAEQAAGAAGERSDAAEAARAEAERARAEAERLS